MKTGIITTIKADTSLDDSVSIRVFGQSKRVEVMVGLNSSLVDIDELVMMVAKAAEVCES